MLSQGRVAYFVHKLDRKTEGLGQPAAAAPISKIKVKPQPFIRARKRFAERVFGQRPRAARCIESKGPDQARNGGGVQKRVSGVEQRRCPRLRQACDSSTTLRIHAGGVLVSQSSHPRYASAAASAVWLRLRGPACEPRSLRDGAGLAPSRQLGCLKTLEERP